jgi:type II secretory pathway component PulJ
MNRWAIIRDPYGARRSPRSPAAAVRPGRAGYTLIEILIATALSLLLLGAVVRMFGDVGQSITDSRSMLESADRLRLTATRLQQDLAGVTVTMNPPRKPENNEGYFEYIEGPQTSTTNNAINTDNNSAADTTVGDTDDILMFTTRSTGQPFVGRFVNGTNGVAQSDVAEVAWFVRGRTLYRRVLLVAPALSLTGIAQAGFYANNDISASVQNGNFVANTLGDLTKRENRFAHQTSAFPFSLGVTNTTWATTDVSKWAVLRLPTLCECSSSSWSAGATLPTGLTLSADGTVSSDMTKFDAWRYPLPLTGIDKATGALSNYVGPRIADDVILTNVIGFDVKAWDPDANTGAGAYVDMGYAGAATDRFAGNGAAVATGTTYLSGVYDTWSTHYESETVTGLGGTPGQAMNGFDDNNNGIVDDTSELRTSPPYPYPLRGIQVKIRVFEPDSRQVREVTVVQDFLTQ